jgi:hypothetical protein
MGPDPKALDVLFAKQVIRATERLWSVPQCL